MRAETGRLWRSRGQDQHRNKAIIAGSQGTCFVIPINTAKWVVSQLISHGRVRRAYLGVSEQAVTLDRRPSLEYRLKTGSGVLVTEVHAGTAAAAAGLRPRDMIVGIGDLPVASRDDLQRILGTHAIGQPLVVRVLRGRELVALEVHPTELPEAA